MCIHLYTVSTPEMVVYTLCFSQLLGARASWDQHKYGIPPHSMDAESRIAGQTTNNELI